MPNTSKISIYSLSKNKKLFFDFTILSTRYLKEYRLFGAPMPGRNYTGTSYRYGMNGQEKDDEIAQGIYTAEYWEYDSRLGRRWNIDPIVKAHRSGYATFANNPIVYADPDGLEEKNQKDANAKKDVKDGDTYTDKNGRNFQYNGGNGGWLEQEAGALNSGSHGGTDSAPTSVATGNASPEKTVQHAEFSVEAYGGGGGAFGLGGEVAVKHFQMIPNIHTQNHLYKDESFLMFDLDGKGGSNGAGVSAEWGDGYLLNTDPWEPYSNQISGVSDYDMGVGASFLSITTTNEVTLGVSRMHYTTMGVSFGFIEKVESPFTVAGGFNATVSFSKPNFLDSAKTALAFPNHAKSKAFIQSLAKRRGQRNKAQKLLD